LANNASMWWCGCNIHSYVSMSCGWHRKQPLLSSLLRRWYWERVSVWIWKRVWKVCSLLCFARPAPIMSPSHSCSSCTWGMKNSTVSSHGDVGRRFDFAPLCYCGEKTIMRTLIPLALTSDNDLLHFHNSRTWGSQSTPLIFPIQSLIP